MVLTLYTNKVNHLNIYNIIINGIITSLKWFRNDFHIAKKTQHIYIYIYIIVIIMINLYD